VVLMLTLPHFRSNYLQWTKSDFIEVVKVIKPWLVVCKIHVICFTFLWIIALVSQYIKERKLGNYLKTYYNTACYSTQGLVRDIFPERTTGLKKASNSGPNKLKRDFQFPKSNYRDWNCEPHDWLRSFINLFSVNYAC